ncbi:MAG TPA: Hsp70 family protein [Firmicutes bacterium]|jgi:molecular chaperone DnaK|nr:Hsp70 family protein [Bacillota bacterium]
MSRTIGIDLGTTNSVAAVIGDNGRPYVLEYGGERIVPSVVAVDDQGKLLVGKEAKHYLPLDPDNAVRSVKRAMGGTESFSLRGQAYSPQQISALILRKLRSLAEEALGEPVERAVITVPAYFTDQQRIATREAGELAGLEVVRIINEPTAAALAYGADRDDGQRILVYDLGGGTFDVSLVQVEGGLVEVLATAGNNRLGGDDFDQRLVDYVSDRFEREHDYNLRENKRAIARLTAAAEEAKIHLSDFPFARIRADFIATVEEKPLHLDQELSRARFEELIKDLLADTMSCIDQVLNDANCTPKQIDKVLLVGGSTRIPAVRELIADHLGIDPAGDIHPDECVALGAAVQAAIIDGLDVDSVLVDVTAHSLGVAARIPGGYLEEYHSVIIPRNTVIPTVKAEVYRPSYDYQETVQIRIYQGENPVASENELLGQFDLTDLPQRPAAEVDIVVTFSMNVDGILQVTAEERSTGRSADITVRDMRAKMSAHEKTMAESAVNRLWDTQGAGSKSTRALIERARQVVEEMEEEEIKDEIIAVVKEIKVLLSEPDYDEDELGRLEDELLDLLEDD